MRYLPIIIALLLSGCYTRPVAVRQHGRLVSTYRDIAVDWCANTFPKKDSLIQGATIVKTDTLWGEGETRVDTIRIAGKPIEVTKTIILPGNTITIERLRVDTVRYENTAAVDLCRIENRALSLALSTEQTRADKMKKQRNQARLILGGMGLLLIGWLFFKLRKPKK